MALFFCSLHDGCRVFLCDVIPPHSKLDMPTQVNNKKLTLSLCESECVSFFPELRCSLPALVFYEVFSRFLWCNITPRKLFSCTLYQHHLSAFVAECLFYFFHNFPLWLPLGNHKLNHPTILLIILSLLIKYRG